MQITLIAALALAIAGSTASASTIDFSDQPVTAQTVVASPLVYAGATFSSPVGLRVLTAAPFYDRALCPHATFACAGVLTIDFTAAADNFQFDVYQIDTTGLLTLGIAQGANFTPQALVLARGIGPRRVSLASFGGITRLALNATTKRRGCRSTILHSIPPSALSPNPHPGHCCWAASR